MFDTTEYIVEEEIKKGSNIDLECRRHIIRETIKYYTINNNSFLYNNNIILNFNFREEEDIEMQVLGGGECTDMNEPSTSGVEYHQNEPSKNYIL